jgi:hypothetical protein
MYDQGSADLEREVSELRDIIAALMIKYAPYTYVSGREHRRAVLNPDVTGAVESSLLLIDTSNPGMVVIRYGAA